MQEEKSPCNSCFSLFRFMLAGDIGTITGFFNFTLGFFPWLR